MSAIDKDNNSCEEFALDTWMVIRHNGNVIVATGEEWNQHFIGLQLARATSSGCEKLEKLI